MDPIRKIPKKVTKKFVSKVINRQYFHRKTGLYLLFVVFDYVTFFVKGLLTKVLLKNPAVSSFYDTDTHLICTQRSDLKGTL